MVLYVLESAIFLSSNIRRKTQILLIKSLIWNLKDKHHFLTLLLRTTFTKKTEYLSIFTCCLDARQYLSRKLWVSSAPCLLALKNNMLSSLKRRWFTTGAMHATLIPSKCDDFRRPDRPSATKRNKYRDIRSPWRRRWDCLNSSVGAHWRVSKRTLL